MASEAQFSGYMSQFLATIEASFGVVKRRPVNVLKEETFPLLAAWMEGTGVGGDASDDELRYETPYTLLVATRLAEDEAQDVALGRLIKLVNDGAEAFTLAGVEMETGDWATDNGAAENEGDRVWAEAPVTLRYRRPRGDL